MMGLVLRAIWPLIGLFSLVLFLAFGLSRDPSVLPSEMIDRPVPEFQLPDLHQSDNTLTQKMFLNEVSLINVFGSWCVACEIEHPKLMTLSRSKSVKLVGIDWRDSREKGLYWLERNGNPYEVVIFDEDSRLAIDLGVTGAPESFIVDKAGRIRYKHVGIISDAIWDDILHPIIKDLEEEE